LKVASRLLSQRKKAAKKSHCPFLRARYYRGRLLSSDAALWRQQVSILALALAVVISLFASYFVALTVVPLFCARFIKSAHSETHDGRDEGKPQMKPGLGDRFNARFNAGFEGLLTRYNTLIEKVLEWPRATLAGFGVAFLLSLALFPLLGLSFFPRTDPGQFVINFKAPSGTKLEATNEEASRLEGLIRNVVSKHDMGMIVTNLGLDPGFSSLFSPNSAMHTGFMQVALRPDHRDRQLRLYR
jgi:multidrug efflux pump subunit AcrB